MKGYSWGGSGDFLALLKDGIDLFTSTFVVGANNAVTFYGELAMNSGASRVRGSRASDLAALLGTASFVAIGSGAAQAQVAEVLITGSLIAGAGAVGVPVTAVGEEEFLEQGAITVADMLYSVPSLQVDASLTSLRGGGTTGYGQNVAIHGFEGSGGDAITLMTINNRRWPIQGHGGDTVDPSIIPQLAVERVDILTAGASAVYGSDAIVGVINVILKRNFEGSVSQVNFSTPVHISQGFKVTASHLHGVSWDTGNITMTAEAYFHQRVRASAIGRDKYTTNFSETGNLGYDITPTALSHPGIVMLGRPRGPESDAVSGDTPGGVLTDNPNFYSAYPDGIPDDFNPITGTRFCSNCYSLPHGIGQVYDGSPVPAGNWTAIAANKWTIGQRNEENQRINYDDSWALPQMQREAFVGTLNQVLTDDLFGLGEVELHGTMFYSNRKGQMHFGINTNSGNSREHASFRRADRGVSVSLDNPYIPTGILAALTANRQAHTDYFFEQNLDDLYNDSFDDWISNNASDPDNPTAGELDDAEAFGLGERNDAGNRAVALDDAEDSSKRDDDLQVQINATPYMGSASRISFENVATRYEFGFNFNSLPFGWIGDMFYSMSNEQNDTQSTVAINRDRAFAALGGTVGADAPFTEYTKPDDVPFLNIFCDALTYGTACNSRKTLDYILGSRLQNNQWRIRHLGANFSGPLFELPSGEILAGISTEHTSQHFWVNNYGNHGTAHGQALKAEELEVATRVAHAFFGQLNIPVLGGEWSIPGFVEGLDVELGYRVDKYDFQDSYIKTPKAQATLLLGQGISLRGAWGKSFRAPGFAQTGVSTGSRAIGANRLQGAGSDDFLFDCSNEENGSASGTAAPGSATAAFNPACLGGAGFEEFDVPPVVEIAGGSGLGSFARGVSQALRPGGPPKGLGPETAEQYVFGFNIAPLDGIFAGLNLDVSYFNIKISDTIRGDESGNQDPDNPLARHLFLLRPSRVGGFLDNGANDAEFDAIIAAFAALPASTSTFDRFLPVDVIMDGANANLGFIQLKGIDWSFRYDWDMGNLGSFHVGNSGYFEIDQLEQANSESPVESLYGGVTGDDGVRQGENSGTQMQRLRTRAGWTDGTWSTTLFATTWLHQGPNTNIRLPGCFWEPGFGEGDCYPGSPYYPQANPDGGFYNTSPGWTQFDVNFSYNTGMMPTNSYLQNLNISLTVNNFLDADPPFTYNSRGRAREIRAYDDRFAELGRFASLTLTKTW